MSMACKDPEGWNPVSSLRPFDLTLCFEEGVLTSSLLAILLVLSALRALFLCLQPSLPLSKKSRLILNLKLVILSTATILSIINVVLIALNHITVPLIQSYILEPITLLLALPFTFFNHTRTRRASAIILLFWPLYTLSALIWTRTVVEKHLLYHLCHVLVFKWCIIALALVSWYLESLGPEIDKEAEVKASEDSEDILDKQELHVEHPTLTASIFSIWSFSWMTPLMRKGASQYITEDDLPSLPKRDESSNLGSKLSKALQKHSLWKSLIIAYGGTYGFAAILKVFADSLNFLQPQLLRWLLSYIAAYQAAKHGRGLFSPSDHPQTRIGPWNIPGLWHTEEPAQLGPLEGFAIAGIMFISSIAQTIFLHQYFQRTFETGMRVRGGLVTVIYDKALVLSNDERGRSTGDIVNLMSVDVTRLQDFCTYGLMFFSGPLQITYAFVSLYNLLGWSAFVGVAIMIISIPLNTVIANVLKKLQQTQMKNRDHRTRLMNELLNNIKSIKLCAWEYTFLHKILNVRNNQELKMLRKIGYVTSCNNTLWAGIPLLVGFASLAVAGTISEIPLTSDIIFPSISLFMLLQFPLAVFAQVTSNLIESLVSIRRLQSFLAADELQTDARTVVPLLSVEQGETVLSIDHGDFTWSTSSPSPVLEDINLTVKKGELVGVMGRVGDGKTSLLSAIIGDLTRLDGEVVVKGSVSYAPQNPWIQSATVRENILFGHVYEEGYYNLVIEACALGPDLAILKDGDMTIVGEKGITLSGGQRARVSLARAVYARADLVLLDDCLAAVDSHVAKHVFDNVIGPNGLLASKARILVTNSISFLRHFDHIIYIRRGIILESGTYGYLMDRADGHLSRLVKGHGNEGGSASTSGAATPRLAIEASPPESEDTATVDSESHVPVLISEKLRHQTSSSAKLAPLPPKRVHEQRDLTKEHTEQGRVKIKVYSRYIEASSKFGFTLFVASYVGYQVFSILSTYVLRAWANRNEESGSNEDAAFYLALYGLASLISTLLGGLGAVMMSVVCSLKSARYLHDMMLGALLRAPLSFFELTPTGRTLNLFSRDTYVVDQVLSNVIKATMRTLTNTVGIIVVVGVSFPPFLIAVIPLGWFYLRVMKYYLATSRELKRLDAVTKSPIFAWFSESLAGVSTIRAFDQQQLFSIHNQRRVDRNQICYLPSISVNRWLAVRLEFVGSVIILLVVVLAVWALITTGVDAGLVGLVLSYAVNMTGALNWLVRSASEVEQNIVSVERMLHQIEVAPEAPQEIPESKPEEEWPSKGGIEFKHYSTRYRPGLDLVLKDVNVQFAPAEKVGLIGRTGSGKSTFLLSLFRIIEPAEGTIIIDGVDITKIGLHDLRYSMCIVPQSPDLFEGTLRENIDPVGAYPDSDIWIALERAHLKEFVEGLPEKLDAPVREGGSSLSAGQRQLLCFARALLRKTKILVLDEATSAVDLDTDQAIQEVIRGPAFRDVTILTIAHRLNTIMDCDRVLVMDAGKVMELDTPKTLLANKSSIFYSLAHSAGLTGDNDTNSPGDDEK